MLSCSAAGTPEQKKNLIVVINEVAFWDFQDIHWFRQEERSTSPTFQLRDDFPDPSYSHIEIVYFINKAWALACNQYA